MKVPIVSFWTICTIITTSLMYLTETNPKLLWLVYVLMGWCIFMLASDIHLYLQIKKFNKRNLP